MSMQNFKVCTHQKKENPYKIKIFEKFSKLYGKALFLCFTKYN